MTKSELILYLDVFVESDKTKSRLDREVRTLEDAISRAKAEPYQGKLDDSQYLTAAGIALAVALLCAWLISAMIALIAFFVVFFMVIVENDMKITTENRSIAEKHKKEVASLPKLERQLQIALSKQKEVNEIYALARKDAHKYLPDAYRYRYCAECFLSYLKNGRADTLKEAINLYEIESRQDAIYEENRRHNEEMERQQQRQTELASEAVAEASRAADASEEAARSADFWGAVNTYQLEEILHKK